MIFALVMVLAILIAVALHELGHLVAAKAFGMRVQEYFIGFGPRLFSRTVGETEVGIKAIPAGGYVRIPGMDLSSKTEPEQGTYASRPWYAQAAVALSGPVTHFVLAFAVLWATFALAAPDPFDGAAGVGAVAANSAAARAGLQAGDVVLAIDDAPVADWDEVLAVIADGEEHAVILDRDGQMQTLRLRDWSGVTVPRPGGEAAGVLGAAGLAAQRVVHLTSLTIDGLAQILAGIDDSIAAALGTAPPTDVRPVTVIGIVDLAGDFGAGFGWRGVGLLVAQVNIAFALFNLLPVHPFDGGHVVAAGLNRALQNRRIRRPALRALSGLGVPALALLLVLFIVGGAIDLRTLV